MRLSWLLLAVAILAFPGVLSAQYTLTIEDVTGDPGTSVSLEVTLIVDDDADEPIGFAYSVCHDVDLVDLDDVDNGPDLDDLDTFFEALSTFDDGWVASVALSFAVDTTIAPGEWVMHIPTYDLGDDEGLADVEFCDTITDPPVTAVVYEGDLEEVFPDLVNGSIDIRKRSVFYTLAIGDGEGRVGATATVAVEFRIDEDEGFAVDGVQFGICHDDLIAAGPEEEDIVRSADLDDLDPEVEIIEVFDEGWTAAVILGIDEALFEPGDYPLYDVTYALGDTTGTSELVFCDTLGDPVIEVLVVAGDEEFEPGTRTSGSIDVALNFTFKRGDADTSGDVSGIPDGLFLLRWQFASGDDPACEDAADADDNGSVSGLADGLYVLFWAFAGGEPPPAPGTLECGADPEGDEPDELGCEGASECD